MQLLVQLIIGIAWPVVVLWIAYLFKRELTALFGRVSRFKYKDVEFEMGLAKAEERATIIQRNETVPQLPDPETSKKFDQLRRIADVSPRAAIMEAWIAIEDAAGRSGFIQGAQQPLINAESFVHYLVHTGKLPAESDSLVTELRNLRDHAAAHKIANIPEFTLTRQDAERYLELAAKVSSMILGPNG